ncbi:hybrid sensor histidine kinase/response regulator [Planctopirus hydrillae]|uniref:histidine kinase n=1 Tax=Planctopirus hydrillae TaxID=1841610 RepID=A0A1C3EHN1_9PLAN|nr:chemotaxis protein CheW [Planctopirus hydrillae]ODA32738.1 chemotaxis protein CheA [Planctopirus hydrillae]
MDEDILQEFLAESWENLAQLDTEVVALEKEPSNSPLLASIFRTIHTIKGTCGFLGFEHLGKVAHATENVLGKMRDGELDVTNEAISLVLDGVDTIKHLLETIEKTQAEPELDTSALIHKLDLLASLSSPVSQPRHAPALTSTQPHALSGESTSNQPVNFQRPESTGERNTESMSPANAVTSSAPVVSANTSKAAEVDPGSNRTGKPATLATASNGTNGESDSESEGRRSAAVDLSIRVNVEVLDKLMNLVGELVLTRNQLLQMVRGEDESRFQVPVTHLNRVTTDLQEGVMKTRMQPIGNAWSKLPRLVRDLSQVTSKQIELEMHGAETELDRTVLDAIKDPLTHMVRNSADHGIEKAEIRRKQGKAESGTIRLKAFHEGGHVIIHVEDDGAGIHVERVRQKVLEKGLATESDLAHLSEEEILQFIFLPGFSTAETVTSVSGRGVGMDVVRTAIERIGGTVELRSQWGQGTTIRIKIPLTLAIISALVVSSSGQSFAIPQLGIVELVRLSVDDLIRIEKIHDQRIFRLRDRLLPLLRLSDALKLPSLPPDNEGDMSIVVVQVGDEQFGLIVDEVFDTQEIVVKPLGSILKDLRVYQGTTILGDGRVIMILDVAGTAAALGGTASRTQRELRNLQQDAANGENDKTSLLLFSTPHQETMAVPLGLVARLEEFSLKQIEQVGEQLVVQYRGDLLPLIPIRGNSRDVQRLDPQPVVVFSDNSRMMGLMVNKIEDIIEETITIRMQGKRPGVFGTTVVGGKATEIIDIQHYLTQANPHWFHREDERNRLRVLAIDDSPFFRQLLQTAIEADGHKIITASGGHQAQQIIERGEQFDVIICDIEMPEMTGCEFAQWYCRRDQQKQSSLIAMTSLLGEEHRQRILKSGFDHFLAKFNPQELSSSMAQICRMQPHSGVSA